MKNYQEMSFEEKRSMRLKTVTPTFALHYAIELVKKELEADRKYAETDDYFKISVEENLKMLEHYEKIIELLMEEHRDFIWG